MRYYKQVKDGTVVAIGTGAGNVEISEDEFNNLLAEIKEKEILVEQLYNKEISIDQVKPEWKKEVQQRVDSRIEYDNYLSSDDIEISNDEAVNIILGV